MQGLPASGKSTRAEKLADTLDVKRINRDLLREMLHFGIYSPETEAEIILSEVKLARIWLRRFYNVIIDDTNLRDHTLDAWKQLAEEEGVEFEIITMDIDVEECIRRDALRDKPVGEEAIRRIAAYEA